MRPPELATDTAKSISYVLHALDTLGASGERYDAVLLLQPTAPIRDVAAIIEAIRRFRASDADSLISCYQEAYINDLVLYYDNGNGCLTPKHPDHNKGDSRQDPVQALVCNGAVYITRTE